MVVIDAATQYNTLQHTVTTHCNTLQHTATHCNTLQHTTTPAGPSVWVLENVRLQEMAANGDGATVQVNFSKVGSLLNPTDKTTIERTFEKFVCIRVFQHDMAAWLVLDNFESGIHEYVYTNIYIYTYICTYIYMYISMIWQPGSSSTTLKSACMYMYTQIYMIYAMCMYTHIYYV